MQERFGRLQISRIGIRILALGIVTYNNSSSQLARLLYSIELASTRLNESEYEARLYTIDCGSPSQWTPITIPQYRSDPMGNLGFGRANNQLMARAFSDPRVSWFLCVNPDGILHVDLIDEMIKCAEQHPGSVVEARQFPEEHPKPYDPQTGLTTWASGACMLIPRKVYEVIGGFDENFFMYMEDVDFSWRARSAGFHIRVAPRALFGHSVLDRQVDAAVEANYYLSGRYLAYKWQRWENQALFERTLLERGYVSTLPSLPALGSSQPVHTDVVAFDHGFAYAPLRWS